MGRKASPNGAGIAAIGLIACACACGGGNANANPAPAPAAIAAEAPKPAPIAVPPGAAPASIDEASFSLRLAEAGPYKAGELGRIVVQLEPRGSFHINQEYPIEIGLTGDADTTFPKANLARTDAAEFGEQKARFEVPFNAKAAGDRKINANIKFAVCTPENCVPDERNLSLALAVK
jgi:hypothetical protein